MKSLVLLVVLFLVGCSNGVAGLNSDKEISRLDAFLELDTFGHTGLIRDIITTDDGEIISASDDKTVRVWNSDGVEKRKILGQVGAGEEGKIFAIALSSDKKYLAVGGYLSGTTKENKYPIRIYHYKTGKLIKVLKSHQNIVIDISFSSDNHYLISGSGDDSAKIWDVKNDFALKDTIIFHKKSVYAVKIIKKKKKYFAITAGDDSKIALYDMQKKQILKSHELKYKLHSLAIATKLKHIALSGKGREIKIYDYNLKLVKTIKSQTRPMGLNYSKDNKYLISGAGLPPAIVNIYKTKNYSQKSVFKKHANLTQAVNFINKSNKTYAISGGGNSNEIYIWDIKSTKVESKIVGNGSSVWSVGVKGDRVAWGNKWTGSLGKSKLQKEINLKNFSIKKVKNNKAFKRISITNGKHFLAHSQGGDYRHRDAILNIRMGKRIIKQITKSSIDGYRNNTYGWYKDYIISGGMNGQLVVYNQEGKIIANLIGHTGEVWSIALDGDRLVSGSYDQTIKIWDLKSLDVSKVKKIANEDMVSLVMERLKWDRKEVFKKADFLKTNKIDIYTYSKQKIYPTLSLFVSKDNEYVAYTKDGFFNSSKKGAKHIGYHINQGVNKEARFISVDKLYDTYHRPDLIAKALNGEDISKHTKDISLNKILHSVLYSNMKNK